MSVKNVHKDPENLTLSVTAEFAAPRERVWQVWAQPELLGRWWGPPGWPATFLKHELVPGGTAHYFMQGPDGSRHYGGWTFTAVDAPRSLALDDYFADENGAPNDELPGTTMKVTLSEEGGVTTMEMVSHFASIEQLEQLAAMGMVEGLTAALGQIDALL